MGGYVLSSRSTSLDSRLTGLELAVTSCIRSEMLVNLLCLLGNVMGIVPKMSGKF